MICESCRDAADLWSVMKDVKTETITDAVEKIISGEYGSRVEELHKQCRGRSWCDCQHKITREVVTT
jgi:hypothetical protein